MPRVNRRDILRTFTSLAALAATPAQALVCEVNRPRYGDISTRSYNCRLGEGKDLTTTFMRISDILADSSGRDGGVLPEDLRSYEDMVSSTHLIENPTLAVFQDLMNRYSYSFSTHTMSVDFDGRGSSDGTSLSQYFGVPYQERFRTLGYWDEANYAFFPFFPLPDLLRQTFQNSDFQRQGFLRFAESSDFIDFEVKLADYLSLWQTETDEEHDRQLRSYTSKSLGPVDIHLDAISAAARFQLAA